MDLIRRRRLHVGRSEDLSASASRHGQRQSALIVGEQGITPQHEQNVLHLGRVVPRSSNMQCGQTFAGIERGTGPSELVGGGRKPPAQRFANTGQLTQK